MTTYNIPCTRQTDNEGRDYTEVPPVGYTFDQLAMRRKAEILKYKGITSSSMTNDPTKSQRFHAAVVGSSGIKVSNGSLRGLRRVGNVVLLETTPECSCSESTASNIPGPSFTMCYDKTVPLYRYQRKFTMNLKSNNL
jgi:hypothetical protein